MLPLQVRKSKKHTAEYKADKPLCGTWAEIDGDMTTLFASLHVVTLQVHSHSKADHSVTGIDTISVIPMFSGLNADDSLAPMDDLLRSSLPADAIPAIISHLPELNVTQPDKVNSMQLSKQLLLAFMHCP